SDLFLDHYIFSFIRCLVTLSPKQIIQNIF
ncbi:hypothetical protein AZZ97_002552, partial [Klebsiella pneumoniae]